MCVARYASHYFSKGAICVPLDDQEKNICTLSSHRATRELYAKVPSHRAPIGALCLCEGSMRIELRLELYAKGALCGSTTQAKPMGSNTNRISVTNILSRDTVTKSQRNIDNIVDSQSTVILVHVHTNDDPRLTAKTVLKKAKYASHNLHRNMYPDVHMIYLFGIGFNSHKLIEACSEKKKKKKKKK